MTVMPVPGPAEQHVAALDALAYLAFADPVAVDPAYAIEISIFEHMLNHLWTKSMLHAGMCQYVNERPDLFEEIRVGCDKLNRGYRDDGPALSNS